VVRAGAAVGAANGDPGRSSSSMDAYRPTRQ
jgi:hypothetical protein